MRVAAVEKRWGVELDLSGEITPGCETAPVQGGAMRGYALFGAGGSRRCSCGRAIGRGLGSAPPCAAEGPQGRPTSRRTSRAGIRNYFLRQPGARAGRSGSTSPGPGGSPRSPSGTAQCATSKGARSHGRRAALLQAYDSQLRARAGDRLPEGVTVERDGPVVRLLGFPSAGSSCTPTWTGSRARARRADRPSGARVRRAQRAPQWKLHGHDLPADLPERLRAAGFVPEEQETVVIAPVPEIAGEPQLPTGVSLREVTAREDLERIAAARARGLGRRPQLAADMLEGEVLADPDALTVLVAEAGETVVCAAWIRYERGTEFATLWGGATLPEWRRRGIYRATGRLPGEPRGRARLPLPRDGRLRRQPPDPRTPRLRRRDHDDAVHLVTSGGSLAPCPLSALKGALGRL